MSSQKTTSPEKGGSGAMRSTGSSAVDGVIETQNANYFDVTSKIVPSGAPSPIHRSRPGFPLRVQDTKSDPVDHEQNATSDDMENNNRTTILYYRQPNDAEPEGSLTTLTGDNTEAEHFHCDDYLSNLDTTGSSEEPNESATLSAVDGTCPNLDDDPNETDQETDRLLDQLHLTDDDPVDSTAGPRFDRRRSSSTRVRTFSGTPLAIPHHYSPAILRHDIGTALSSNAITFTDENAAENPSASTEVYRKKEPPQRKGSGELRSDSYRVRKNGQWDPELLIEGVLFRANYLGSTQLLCDGRPTKTSRMIQAEEAVSRIKAPVGESQPSTEVDLCISTEKIMVLSTDTKDAIMDPTLRSISYIADIGDLVVLMARRSDGAAGESTSSDEPAAAPPAKILCHVFESKEATIIAQSIGQAFQVAYAEFLRANGLTDDNAVRDIDYQQVLNSQEIDGNELAVFTHKELQKDIHVTKAANDILGLVLVESGWGSLIPTVVVANLLSTGASARSGDVNIGDQIIAVNGMSLVGLPLATSQNYISTMAKGQTSVRLTIVPCPPVVEVKVRRPDTKFQLGFSVQNGIICSLLRGGIAERGGVRVGHRIIEINDQSVVAVRHEQIVSLLATAVGEIRMKTMPTAMFRLLTGQENPTYI